MDTKETQVTLIEGIRELMTKIDCGAGLPALKKVVIKR
jgi:hypothetical protein